MAMLLKVCHPEAAYRPRAKRGRYAVEGPQCRMHRDRRIPGFRAAGTSPNDANRDWRHSGRCRLLGILGCAGRDACDTEVLRLRNGLAWREACTQPQDDRLLRASPWRLKNIITAALPVPLRSDL